MSADRSTKTQRDRLEKIVEYFARAHSTALTQKQEKDKISEIKKQYEGSLKELCWFLGIDTDRCTARKISPMINETGRDLLLNSLKINSEREGARRKGEATGQTDGQTEIRAPATLN